MTELVAAVDGPKAEAAPPRSEQEQAAAKGEGEQGGGDAEAAAADDDDDDPTSPNAEELINARLAGHFRDEFTPLQMLEFLLPGSSPVRCDRDLGRAAVATLLQWALAALPQPPLLYAVTLVGHHRSLAAFPLEVEKAERRDWLHWLAVGVVALIALQSAAHCLHACAHPRTPY